MVKLAEVYPRLVLRSALPGGGCPSLDKGYLAWRDVLVADANDRICDRHDWRTDLLPVLGIIHGYDIDRELFTKTAGPELFEDRWNYSHRLRHLSNALRDHPRSLARLAQTYIQRVTAIYEGE